MFLSKVFIEILFWKNVKEAVDIECGYDAPPTSKAAKSLWSEEDEDELACLFRWVDLLFVQFILVQPVFVQPVFVQSISSNPNLA